MAWLPAEMRVADFGSQDDGDEALPILHELAAEYGLDTPLRYVGDCWGPGTDDNGPLTPREVIEFHRDLDWDDTNYAVRAAFCDEDPVLVDQYGRAILELIATDSMRR